MTTYIVRRLLQAIPLLLVISIVLFGLLQLIPGGPAQVALSPRMSEQARHDMVVALGLDQPAPIQYVKWLWGTVHLDFGNTFKDGRPVLTEIGDRLPATVELLGLSFLVALLCAIPLGIIAAVKQYSIVDYVLTVLSYIGISMPVFWFAEMLILVFAIQHGWFPTSGRQTEGGPSSFWDSAHHLVLPVIVLALAFIASWSRYLRSSMLEVLHQDYLRTARAKGVQRLKIIVKHAFRNALIPLVTVVALDVGGIFGGAVITETIFAWPGLGRLFYDALSSRDYPVLMAMMELSAVTIVLCNIIADIIYGILDPRIRYS
ncbi:MAG: diguanylate cyclase [Chloroflexi bacterium]|nr:diguanylate cyclase [Chloroflexota bacterium]